jgi:hypothetical protein
MSDRFQRNRRRKEFSINRRRNLKSNKILNIKDIFIKYAELSTHDSNIEHSSSTKKSEFHTRQGMIQFKRIKKKNKLSNEVIMYDNQQMIEKFLTVVQAFNI